MVPKAPKAPRAQDPLCAPGDTTMGDDVELWIDEHGTAEIPDDVQQFLAELRDEPKQALMHQVEDVVADDMKSMFDKISKRMAGMDKGSERRETQREHVTDSNARLGRCNFGEARLTHTQSSRRMQARATSSLSAADANRPQDLTSHAGIPARDSRRLLECPCHQRPTRGCRADASDCGKSLRPQVVSP